MSSSSLKKSSFLQSSRCMRKAPKAVASIACSQHPRLRVSFGRHSCLSAFGARDLPPIRAVSIAHAQGSSIFRRPWRCTRPRIVGRLARRVGNGRVGASYTHPRMPCKFVRRVHILALRAYRFWPSRLQQNGRLQRSRDPVVCSRPSRLPCLLSGKRRHNGRRPQHMCSTHGCSSRIDSASLFSPHEK